MLSQGRTPHQALLLKRSNKHSQYQHVYIQGEPTIPCCSNSLIAFSKMCWLPTE